MNANCENGTADGSNLPLYPFEHLQLQQDQRPPDQHLAMAPVPSEISLEEYLSNAPPVVLPDIPSSGRNKRRKRGPPGVKWTMSKERQLLRLYELTEVKIEDIPVVMSDANLKFSKRHAQEKLNHYLGDRPAIFRPKDATEALERVVKGYALKEDLKLKGDYQYTTATPATTQSNGKPDGPFQYSSAAKEWLYEIHQINPQTLQNRQSSEDPPRATGINTEEKPKLTLITQKQVAPLNRRTSIESLQSLQRRMASRSANNGHALAQYSSMALQNIIFVKRRLSISSVASGSSMTTISTTHSWEEWKRQSVMRQPRLLPRIQKSLADLRELGQAAGSATRPFADLFNSASNSRVPIKPVGCRHGPPCKHILTPLEHSLTKSCQRLKRVDEITKPTRVCLPTALIYPPHILRNYRRFPKAVEKLNQLAWTYSIHGDNQAFSDVYRKAHSKSTWDAIKNVEDFPSTVDLTGDIPLSPCGAMTIDCCQNFRRGDPRASKCRICRLAEPIAHAFVRFAVLAWQNGDNTPIRTKFASSGIPQQDLYQVDMFYDTVLHTAARNGASIETFEWLLRVGIDAHALNAAGQTFMHVLNPVGFDAAYYDAAYRGHEFYDHYYTQLCECKIISFLGNLLSSGFDFYHQDDYGQTPLHVFTNYRIHWNLIAVACSMMNHSGCVKIGGRSFSGNTVVMQVKSQVWEADPPYINSDVLDAMLRGGSSSDNDSIPMVVVSSNPEDVLNSDSTTTERAIGSEKTPSQKFQELFDQALEGHDSELWGRNALHSLAKYVSLCESERNHRTSTGTQKRKHAGNTDDEQRKHVWNLIQQLVKAGVNVNGYDRSGHTPIMAFVRRDHSASLPERRAIADVLGLLIRAGACVHRRSRKGETALHIAMRLGSHPAVEVLLANHANVHSRSGRGDSILQTAMKASVKAGKTDAGLYGRIIACINLAIAHGAVEHPNVKLEWDEQIKCRKLSNSRRVEV